MSGIAFEQIAQEILKMKERLEEMLAENEELRRQINDLREGRGIFVDIAGKRFALTVEMPDAPASSAAPTEIILPTAEEQDVPEMPTLAFVELPPIEIEAAEEPQFEQAEENEATAAPTFLEEMLVSEFAEAATNASAIWSDPDTTKQPSVRAIDEDQKAALRKALIGSFLLE